MLAIYNSAFMPTFSLDYSWKLLKAEIKDQLTKASRQKKRLFEDEAFKNDCLANLKKIFQFSIRCRCFIDSTSIDDITRAGCSCKNEDKIPNLAFYKDQMFGRSIVNLLPEEDKAYFKRFMRGDYCCMISCEEVENTRNFRESNVFRPLCSRNFQNVKLNFNDFTITQILREIQFWRIQIVQKCNSWQF